jgi:hypothetical protein
MIRWQEHLPAASATLRSTFGKAVRDRAPFSAAERAIFTACDFWAAVCARELAPYLGPHPLEALRYVGILYVAIGAHGVASSIIVAVQELECDSIPQQQQRCLSRLQSRLLEARDPVDSLIARLAQSLGIGIPGDYERPMALEAG